MGRIYVPLADLARFDYGEADLLGGVVDDRFRAVMAFEAGRARSLLNRAARCPACCRAAWAWR